MLCVFMIMKIVMKFELFLRVLWKMDEFVICVGMMVLIQFSYGFECLFMPINVWTNFGNQFGHWGIKIGILGQKWGFPESIVVEFCHNSPRRFGVECCMWELAMASRLLATARCTVIVPPVSRFLRHFCMFLFWIGFWCKHESFR